MTVIVGLDPGGASTGIVVRRGSDCLAHAIVQSDPKQPSVGAMPAPEYLRCILDAIDLAQLGTAVDCYAIESVNAPHWHMGGKVSPMNPAHLIAVSAVAGALCGVFVERSAPVVLVAPGRNGSSPLHTYPPQLVGAREKSGGGILRHARSAWDVAGAARNYARSMKESV